MRLVSAVRKAVRSLDLSDPDKAAVELALAYAHHIDDAELVTVSITKALRELAEVDMELHDKFLSLATRIEQTTVLTALGPKLLAALESLGASPRARAALVKGGTRGGSTASPLDELRRKRAARQRDPAAMDTTAADTDT